MAGPNLSTTIDSAGKVHYYNTPTGYSNPVEISKLSYDTALRVTGSTAQLPTNSQPLGPTQTNLATENAASILKNSLAAATPGSPEQTQLSIALYNLKNETPNSTERKTIDTTESPSAPTALGKNILHNYRSFSYNFTLSAITSEEYNNPSLYNTSVNNLQHIVLSSKGKPSPVDNNKISENAVNVPQAAPDKPVPRINSDDNVLAEINAAAGLPYEAPPPSTRTPAAAAKKINVPVSNTLTKDELQSVISDFNTYSSGRFDMYIDDVEIGTLISNNEQTTTAIAYDFKFNVIEPYSVFGFFEALQAAALAAGYFNYMDCNYVLAVDFIGYPDTASNNNDLPGPVTIVDPVHGPATRFFAIKMFDVSTSVTEKGTTYVCKAIAGAAEGLSDTEGHATSHIVLQGDTVKKQLTNLMDSLTLAAHLSSEQMGDAYADDYAVEFPEFDSNGDLIEGAENEIATAKFELPAQMDKIKVILDKQNRAAEFNQSISVFDPTASNKSKIESVIFKSTYITDLIIASYDTGKNIDSKVDNRRQAQMFRVVPKKIEHPDKINVLKNRCAVTWVYQILKTRTSYHRVPGQSRNITNIDDIRSIALREYNYIYTGLNVDVIDFKVDFNFAYFEALSPNFGASPGQNSAESGAAKSDKPNQKLPTGLQPGRTNLKTIPWAPWKPIPSTSDLNPDGTVSATAPVAGDATLQQTIQTYKNLMNSPVALVNGDLTILGDPYWLVSGGSGNYIPNGNVQGSYAKGGEASVLAGDVLVLFNFYNPIDIGTDGFLKIDKSPAGFSGIFQVIKVTSLFKNGEFTQVLNYIRLPTPPDNKIPTSPKVTNSTSMDPTNVKTEAVTVPDATQPVNSSGITTSALVNAPPAPPTVTAPVSPPFPIAGNPVNKSSVASFTALAAGIAAGAAILKNPFAPLQATVANLQATVNGTIKSAENQVTGSISNIKSTVKSAENQITSVASVSPLSTIIRRG